jgi:hypothetical protein
MTSRIGLHELRRVSKVVQVCNTLHPEARALSPLPIPSLAAFLLLPIETAVAT